MINPISWWCCKAPYGKHEVTCANYKNPHAKALGKLGGKASAKVKSAAKAEASRKNGKLGGRPKRKEKEAH